MDEFARAEQRMEKRHERLGVPKTVAEAAAIAEGAETVTLVTEFAPEPQEKSEPAPPTRKAFNRLAVAITNGDETYLMEFEADDLLENMMHSDRTEAGVKDRLLSILRAHLTSGLR